MSLGSNFAKMYIDSKVAGAYINTPLKVRFSFFTKQNSQNRQGIQSLNKITSNPTPDTFLLSFMPYVHFMILKTHKYHMIVPYKCQKYLVPW